jgi:5-methylcytosine-specific restriction endonuclease McrA
MVMMSSEATETNAPVYQRTLVLDRSYRPHGIVSWKRAIILVFDERAEVVSEYDIDIRSPSTTIKMPAVIRLLHPIKKAASKSNGIKFSRFNVMARDGFECQYCGTKLPMTKLNYDHVKPRSHGGKTVWENIVTSCYPCNERKGDRTPEEAGMRLRRKPTRPTNLPTIGARVIWATRLPEPWIPWVEWSGAGQISY